MIPSLDHIQMAIPRNGEALARAFWCDLVGLDEIEKPPQLARRGGLWLRLKRTELHLGVDPDFRPAKKAHPGFRVGALDDLAHRIGAAGHPVRWDSSIQGSRRFFTEDPFGNRVEFLLEDKATGSSSCRKYSRRRRPRTDTRARAGQGITCQPQL